MSTAGLIVDTDEIARRAEHLLGQWGALSMQHVALAGACACGMGGISLRLDDFELDIVGYLEDAGLRCETHDVVAFFTAWSQSPAPERPLRRLLEDAGRQRLPATVAEWLLPKVERTLRSFAELHGPTLER